MYFTQLKLVVFSIIMAPHITCGVECPPGFFDCLNEKCVDMTWVCDGEDDCGNLKDEEECDDKPENCPEGEFMCEDGKGCKPLEYKCDGDEDCLDGSDEKQCPNCENMNCSQLCNGRSKEPFCYCNDGYEVDENDHKNCIDVDECQFEGICSHDCLNTIGSFKCICKPGYEPINRICKAKDADPLLIFSTKNEIQGFFLRSNRTLLIRPIDTRSAGVDLDPNEERIYGFESTDTRTIFSVKIDGTDYKTIRIESLRTPQNLAVDYIAHNIYITDSGLSQIFACKIDATWCIVLHDKNGYKPHSIALDIAEGYMFWSGIGEKSGIYQSEMDGSAPLHLVSNDIVRPTGLALDHTTKMIYWTDAKLDTIESSDFSGRSRKVLSRTRLLYPFSLVVFEDHLFWSHALLSSVKSCNKFACHRKTVIPHKLKRSIWGVRVNHPELKQNISNPCLLSNCSHICLIKPGNNFRCVCVTDYKLSTDQKTCLKIDSCRGGELLCPLTGQCISRNFICDGHADCPDKRDEENCTKSRREAIFPYKVSEGNEVIFVGYGSTVLLQEKTDVNESLILNFTLTTAMISGLAYDSTMKSLFIADLKMPSIYAMNLESLQVVKLVSNLLMCPEDIAFDWMSNNLYWVDSVKGTVEVASVSNRKRVIVLDDLEKPVSLALSSFSGNMFISTIGGEDCVAMYGMDGKNKRILNSVQGLPISLALHPLKTILYWTDPRAGAIFYFNYTSSRSPWILKSGINGLMSVAVSVDNLYWTAADEPLQSEIAGRIYVQKLSGSRNRIRWRKIAHSSGKSFSGKSECLINNGGCSYLCLTSQNGRTCACSSAMSLHENRRNCYGKKCKENDFKCFGGQCIPGEMKCDDSVDCNDGSDELNCTEQTYKAVTVNMTLIQGLLKPKVDLVPLPLNRNIF